MEEEEVEEPLEGKGVQDPEAEDVDLYSNITEELSTKTSLDPEVVKDQE